jgi:NTP pyrophosphatase (non-canonical NTP hydrolase)
MDSDTSIQDLKKKVKAFCDVRDWDQFHDAKELAIALSIEASELLEHFRWKTREEVKSTLGSKKREDVEDEMADILYFLIRIAQMNNVDLSDALERKMKKNDKKYPIEKAKGSNKKYNEL